MYGESLNHISHDESGTSVADIVVDSDEDGKGGSKQLWNVII